jgi:hypothetical protein
VGRAERLRRQWAVGGDGAKKKSPLPLVLAGVGVLALLGAGTAVLLGGGDKTPQKPPETGPGAGGGAAKKEKPAAEKTFEELDAAQRVAYLDAKRKEAAAGGEATKEVVGWMRSKGLSEDAQHLLDEGKKAFPSDPWINSELGFVNRIAEVKKFLDDDMLMEIADDDPDMVFIRGLHDRAKADKNAAWMPKADSEKLDKSMAALKVALAELQDPVKARTVSELKQMKGNPAFTDLTFAANGNYRPYVLFAEAPSEERMKEAESTVARTGRSLTFIYGRWLEFMKDELKMDPPRMEDLKDERLKVFVFKSRESFDAWHTRNQMQNPGSSTAAYYEHGRDRMILMHLDAFDPSVIMHEGTHQIIHFYAHYFCEQADRAEAKKNGDMFEPVKWDDHRLHSSFFWFQEGIAEYFGGAGLAKREEDWKVGILQKNRIDFFRFEKDRQPPKTWPVEDFLFADQSQIETRSKVRGGGAGMGDELKGLMYAQGWTMVHYLLNGEDGKWRPGFLSMIRNELSGVTGKPYLLKAFGLPPRSDDPKVKAFVQEIETGYLKYFDRIQAESRKE